MQDFITFNNVSFSYETEENNNKNINLALDKITLSVKKGEFLAVVGHNGSGKSTLSKLMNSLLLPTSGTVIVDGIDTSDSERTFGIRRRVGLVQQNPDNQLVTSIVEDDVAFAPENLGVEPAEIRRRVDEALKAVDMYEYRHDATYNLSGGQKQRVAIAGIVAMRPQCIVLDEPTAMLDPQGRDEVISTVTKLNKEKGITVVLVTHYMEEAASADRIIVVDSGKVLTQGTPKEVFSQVELLKSHSLSVPQPTELIYMLKMSGADISENVITDEECIEAVEKLLKSRKQA